MEGHTKREMKDLLMKQKNKDKCGRQKEIKSDAKNRQDARVNSICDGVLMYAQRVVIHQILQKEC